MLNASVGVQRVVERLRRPPSSRASSATTAAVNLGALRLQRRVRVFVAAARVVGSRVGPRPGRMARGIAGAHPVRQARVSLIARVGHDRAVALVAAGILLAASVVSVSGSRPAPATGGPTGPGTDVRIAVGGGGIDPGGTINEVDPPADELALSRIAAIDDTTPPSGAQPALGAGEPASQSGTGEVGVQGPFLDDGTLLKPVAVDTTVADGSGLMETYKVKSGDTLTGIASRFGVSMMTIWWANSLKSKDDLHLGQVLTIPPVTGLVLTVTSSDTLVGLAARYNVDEQEISTPTSSRTRISWSVRSWPFRVRSAMRSRRPSRKWPGPRPGAAAEGAVAVVAPARVHRPTTAAARSAGRS